MAIDLRGRSSVSFYDTFSEFPPAGSTTVLYVDRADMVVYIWNGTSYDQLGGGSSITTVENYAALLAIGASNVPNSFYWCSSAQGISWLPGPLGGTYYNSGLYYSNGTTWEYMNSPYQATQAEVNAGIVGDKFVTPSTLYNSTQWSANPITIGTTPITSGVAGRVLFEGSGNVVQEDAGLFWDNVNKRLGIGTSAPNAPFSVQCNSSGLGFNLRQRVGDDFANFTFSKSGDVALGGLGYVTLNRFRIMAGGFGDAFERLSIFHSSGNVSINQKTDSGAKLHVQAQGALSTDIAFRIRNSADTFDIIRANGAGEVFVGLGAGNVSTGGNNAFFGYQAGRNNTIGTNNTANGAAALQNNTIGGGNTANGAFSLYDNTTGGNNTANGFRALQFNTTGTNNTANGVNSLYFNTTGNGNIAQGRDSGRFIADGTTPNTITNSSVYLGFNTKALANNQTNQIVIGHEATGLGSNTAVLGNDSITLTGLKGNVAIGATTASAKLDVRAQGALSTDIAFRVRNSADTENIFQVNGLREAQINGGAFYLYQYGSASGQRITLGISEGGMVMGVESLAVMNTNDNRSSALLLNKGLGNNIFLGNISKPYTAGQGNAIYQAVNTTINPTIANAASTGVYDFGSGNTYYVKTPNGSVVKLYQETTAVTASTFVANTGNYLREDSTFDGYTMKQVVKALRNMGILA